MQFADACKHGQPLSDELIIDAHGHAGPYYNFHVPQGGEPEAMCETMDLCGIDITLIAPHVGLGPDCRLANVHAHEAFEEFDGRFVPLVMTNPNYGVRRVGGEIEYWQENADTIAGFKIHPGSHETKVSDDAYMPVFEYADEHGLAVLSHSWANDNYGGPELLAEMAETFPEATIVIAHTASSWQMCNDSIAQAQEHDNLYLDITGSSLYYRMLEDMVSRIGAQRILFGSDNPFMDPRPGLGRVLTADLTDDEKRQILGLNACRVYGL